MGVLVEEFEGRNGRMKWGKRPEGDASDLVWNVELLPKGVVWKYETPAYAILQPTKSGPKSPSLRFHPEEFDNFHRYPSQGVTRQDSTRTIRPAYFKGDRTQCIP